MMIFISEILIYIEAECIGFLHLGDLGERVGEHVVLLNPVSGSRRMIVHPMGEANPGVPLFGADSERGAETGEDREPEGLEGGPHVDDHVVAGAMDRFPHFFDIASEMAVLIIVECDATVHIGMAGIKGVYSFVNHKVNLRIGESLSQSVAQSHRQHRIAHASETDDQDMFNLLIFHR